MGTRKPAEMDPLKALGLYANAFRVVVDAAATDQHHCLLEFLVYSGTEDLAQVVGRVRVRKGLLPRLRDTITEVL